MSCVQILRFIQSVVSFPMKTRKRKKEEKCNIMCQKFLLNFRSKTNDVREVQVKKARKLIAKYITLGWKCIDTECVLFFLKIEL